MKKFSKIFKVTGIILLIIIGILFAAPFFFKDKLVAVVKEQLNKQLVAKTDFSDLNLSFFRHFPKVSLALEKLSIVGLNDFTKDTLISADEIDVAVNLFSVLNTEDMKISSINISHPRIHAIVLKDGRANWDISRPSAPETSDSSAASPFKLTLQHYSIEDAYVKYDDASAGMSSEIFGLNHEGSGDFTANIFTLKTNSHADALSFVYEGIPYLASVKTDIAADIQVDNQQDKYSFETDNISINDLLLSSKGYFQFVNDTTYGMDISFKTPSNDFKSILSLVPVIYQKDFDKIKTSGKATFDGFVKGNYNSTQIPAYAINLKVDNGFFQYPDLPEPVKNINLQLNVNNPDGITDHTVIKIPQAHIEFGKDPFDLSLLLSNPVTSQNIDAAVKGKLDLGSLARFVKLDEGTRLGGQLNADLQAKGQLAVVTQQKPGNFSANGLLEIRNLLYASRDFPQALQNSSATIKISNPDGVADHTLVNIPAAHIEVGKDAADLSLQLKTPASDPDFAGSIKGSFNLANVKQFYAMPAGTSLAGLINADVSFKGKKSYIDKERYDALQTGGSITASKISYSSPDYPDPVKLETAKLLFSPTKASLENLNGSYLQTNFNANGSFDNIIGYALKDEPLSGKLNVNADKMDLNKFMGSSSASTADSAAASSEPFAVPANLNLTLNATVGALHYDKVDYQDLRGSLQVKDQTIYLNNVQMKALDGSIALGGSYSTKLSRKKPDITLKYDVENLDVQKTFYAFNTVQKLMPIGKFIAGKLTSQLTMKGKLGEDMMPDMGTLTGEGTLFLIQGFLSKFQPLEKLASTLQVADLQQISLKDIKNYFEFANGKVLVKPFHVKVKDIDMEIGGMHGLDQSIDYVINMKIPREKLGSQANQLVNNLAAQASNKGIPIKVSDVIDLKVNLGGSLTQPVVKTDLKGAASSLAEDMKSQMQELVDAKKKAADSVVASAKQEVKDSLNAVKKQLAQDALQNLQKQLSGNKESSDSSADKKDSKQKLEESAKGLLNSLIKKKDKKSSDSTKKN